MVEKQLAAVYAALLATEAVPGTAPITVRTTHAIAGWVGDWMARPRSGLAQTPTLVRWGASLQQSSTLSTSPLRVELQQVSGSVIYIEEKSTRPVPVEEMEASPFQEGHTPIPSDAWYTDGCSGGQPAVRTTVAICPHMTQSGLRLAWNRAASGRNSEPLGSWHSVKPSP